MTAIFEGRVHKLPDHINTDYIISSRRKRDTLDLSILKKWLMEDLDPDFAAKVQAGDILAAGINFGCGSAMEVASLVIRASGIRVIIAKSFARSFYRNAINGGLLPIEADSDSITDEDQLRIELEGSHITLHNLTQRITVTASAPGGLILEIVEAGSLVNFIHRTGDFPAASLS